MPPEDELRRRQAQQAALGAGLNRVLRQPRQPMDERLPSGETPNDLLARLQHPSARISVSSRPGVGIRGLEMPQPSAPVSIPDDTGVQFPTPPQSPSPSVGPSVTGLRGTDRQLALRDALQTADPTSRVSVRGDQIDITPPEMKGVNQRSRFRSALEAAGAGLAMGDVDPNHPLRAVGAALGGGLTGLVSPRSGAQLSRRFELGQLDNDIARGLKLEQEQAQLGGIEALRRQREMQPALDAAELQQKREIENARLEIERQKATGAITKAEADRQQRELDRRSRETIAAENRASREKVAGMRGNGTESRERKATAARNELAQLIEDERVAGENKNRAYTALEKERHDNPNSYTADQMEVEARRLDAIYQSYADKKREAQRKIDENVDAAPQQAQPYAGRTMTRANLERYAKDKGLSAEEAQRQVEAQGVRVQ